MDISIGYLPPFIVFLLGLTISITLYLTYNASHVSGSLPYISDTGTLPPESCIFGQALNLLWVLASVGVYVKYRQNEDILTRHNVEKSVLNKRTMYVGLLASFGMSIVANFQETNMFYVHWFGAILAFGIGSIYLCLQTLLYLSITPIIGQRRRTGLRLAISAISVITFLIFFICAMLSYAYKKKEGGYLHWKKDDGGYEYHNISVVVEWICATCIITYLSMFYWEFKKITFHEPRIFVQEKTVSTVDLH